MVKVIKTLAVTLLVFFLLITVLWLTLPSWLPSVAGYFLPKGTHLALSQRASLVKYGFYLPDVRYYAGDCQIASFGDSQLTYTENQWHLSLAMLNIDSRCFTQIPDTETTASSPSVTLTQLQQLPNFSVDIAKVDVLPWPKYTGQLQFTHNQQGFTVDYNGGALVVNASLDIQHQLTISKFDVLLPVENQRITLSGEIELADNLNQLPQQGTVTAQLNLPQIPQPLTAALNWQDMQGSLTVNQQGDMQPLIRLPWQRLANSLSINQGEWRWPYGSQALSGAISMTLSQWNETFTSAHLQARISMLTQGQRGKSNVVLTLGPGIISPQNSELNFQLTGSVASAHLQAHVSLPGIITSSLLDPTILIHSGALARVTGQLSDDINLHEIRFPLAGIRLTKQGISGRLQAIVKAKHRYWGPAQLHLDGKADNFLPNKGIWQWVFWGNGKFQPLAGDWDIRGRGQWHENRITVNNLSAGFDRLHYGSVTVDSPRLSLVEPAKWDRINDTYQLQAQLQADKVALVNGGYLPRSVLSININGTSPSAFNWQGDLKTEQIGPIRLNGRWDGQRLRGEAWWPKESLTVFQTLLAKDLDLQIRNGTLYAQAAFSAAQEQGFEAGGHLVVNDGAMWMREGDLSGLDFIASFRLKDHIWQLGPKEPISLRISQLNNVFQMNNISADLQGSYPYSQKRPLSLSNTAVELMSGRISLSTLTLPQYQASTLTLDKIELSELFSVLQLKEIAMSGRVSGELPLYLNNPDWLIREGWIENVGPVTLRLDQQLLSAISENNPIGGSVIDWLGYMEISRLRGDVSVSNLGALNMNVQIKGINSSKSQQRSLVLNYQHQENIFELWRSLSFGTNLQNWLEKTLSSSRRD